VKVIVVRVLSALKADTVQVGSRYVGGGGGGGLPKVDFTGVTGAEVLG